MHACPMPVSWVIEVSVIALSYDIDSLFMINMFWQCDESVEDNKEEQETRKNVDKEEIEA